MKFLLQVDILVPGEINFDNSFPSSLFLIESYSNSFKLDRNRNGGALIVSISEYIFCKELKFHNIAEDIEGIFIEINLRKYK